MNGPETTKVIEFHGAEVLTKALRFYERSPDGQYDEIIADLLRALLKDVETA